MRKHTKWTTAVLCGSAMLLSGAVAPAQNQREQDRENASQSRSSQNRDAGDQQNRSQGQRGERGQDQLPQAIQELDLSEQQQQQLRQAVRQHNQKLRQTWQEFHAKHMQAVDIEAAWVAAVRDTLSEQDKQKFDQVRMQDEEMRSRQAAPSGNRADRESGARTNRDDQAQDRTQNREPQSREDRADRQNAERDSDVASSDQQNRSQTRRGDRNQARSGQRPDVVILSFTVTPEKYLTGTEQSAEQQKQCSEVCEKYKGKLTNLWTEMHQLHHELVKIEAERIQAIEKTLTEEQLTQLREGRQEPQESAYTSTQREGDDR